jgi:hypothetical protein
MYVDSGFADLLVRVLFGVVYPVVDSFIELQILGTDISPPPLEIDIFSL